MNEILKKRIEEAADYFGHLYPRVSVADVITFRKDAFIAGADYALSHQWISVEEALPEYDEAVIVRTWNGLVFFCHRSNRIGVKTDEDKWCNYTDMKIVAWMPTPKIETKEKE